MKFNFLKVGIALMALLLELSAGSANAQTSTFDTSSNLFAGGTANQGWYDSFGNHDQSNPNYIVGLGDSYRDFFTFDLSGLDVTGKSVTSATLNLFAYDINSSNPTEIFQLFDVSTLAATLNSDQSGLFGQSVYADLGSGTSYGNFTVNTTADNSVLSFNLNADALAAIQSGAGGWFSIGGKMNSSDTGAYIYGFSGDGNEQSLTVTLQDNAPVVPEPGSLALFLPGLTALGLVKRRRKTFKA